MAERAWLSLASLLTCLFFLVQAMYQLAPDEKRRDCGLNVLDTYFNNGVRRMNMFTLIQNQLKHFEILNFQGGIVRMSVK